MPEQIIPAGYGRCTMEVDFSGPGSPAMLTFGFLNTGYTGDLDADANTIGQIVANNLDAQMSTHYTFQDCRIVVNVAGVVQAGEAVINQPGDFGGTASPPQVAYLAGKKSELVGRKHRGRWYIPGVPESVVDNNGLVDSVVRAGVTSACLAVLADLDTANFPMYILHTDATAPTEVKSMSCDAYVATQRRRLR